MLALANYTAQSIDIDLHFWVRYMMCEKCCEYITGVKVRGMGADDTMLPLSLSR